MNKFSHLGIDLKNKTSGKLKTWCPVCAKRKGHKRDLDLSVDIDRGLYKCHNSNCNFVGKVSDKEYKRPEYRPNNAGLPNDLRIFLKSRGIKDETAIKNRVTYHNGSVYFNYFKGDILVNYKERSITEKVFKQYPQAEKILYNYNSLFSNKKCIIVEGEIDTLTWMQLVDGYAIVSIDQGAGQKGSSLDGKLECITNCASELDNIEEFYLAGDNDEPGDYTFREIARRLGEYRCKRVDYGTHKDANEKYLELLKAGLSDDLIEETFKRLILDAKPFPVSGIIELDNEIIAQLLDEYDNGIDIGFGIGQHPLDDKWTILPGEMTLFTGYPADGKSQTLRSLAVIHAIKSGLKFACYCVEDYPASYFYSDLAQIFMGKQISEKYRNRATKEEYLSALEFIKSRFFYIYPEPDKNGNLPIPTNAWINEKIKFLKLQYGVNSYIKDPWNKIYHDIEAREDQYLMRELSSEKMFAAGYIACWYVAHPKNFDTRARMKDGNVPPPSQYDLSGGAMFNNMMDNIIVVWRPERETNPTSGRVQWIIKKIKKKGVRGSEGAIEMVYDIHTKRYTPHYEELKDAEEYDPYKIPKDINLFDDLPF